MASSILNITSHFFTNLKDRNSVGVGKIDCREMTKKMVFSLGVLVMDLWKNGRVDIQCTLYVL